MAPGADRLRMKLADWYSRSRSVGSPVTSARSMTTSKAAFEKPVRVTDDLHLKNVPYLFRQSEMSTHQPSWYSCGYSFATRRHPACADASVETYLTSTPRKAFHCATAHFV